MVTPDLVTLSSLSSSDQPTHPPAKFWKRLTVPTVLNLLKSIANLLEAALHMRLL
jgi:hypothetical protein